MGFVGRGGGRWGRIPRPEFWYGSTVQVNGIYPFASGTARPTSGAPLGQDMRSHTAVAFDHDSLYQEGVISSPSMMVYGINGLGKSSLAQTITLGMMGRGMIPALHNPLKRNEHTPLIEAAGGVVFDMGPRARHRMNLLSLGPMGKAARRIGGALGDELMDHAIYKSVQHSQVALRINRGRPLEDIEDTLVEALVQSVFSKTQTAGTADLLAAYDSPSPDVLARVGQPTADTFHARFAGLGESIRAMLGGDIGRLLGGSDSVEIDPGNRGGFCFDTSSIPRTATKLLSTAMLLSWSLMMDAIDAHWEIATAEGRKADEALHAGEWYEPEVVWTGYTTLMDEFWYPLRSVKGIAEQADSLSRSNRADGVAEMKVTHSPKDLLSLPDPADREIARGLTERAGLLAMMALTREDLHTLAEVKSLTDQEINEVATFNAAHGWGEQTRSRGEQAPPPGAGKVMFKVDGRPGVPVQMLQTAAQRGLHTADARVREQRRSTFARRDR